MAPRPRPAGALHPAQLVAEAQPEGRILHHKADDVRSQQNSGSLGGEPIAEHENLSIKPAKLVEPADILKALAAYRHGGAESEFGALNHVGYQHAGGHLHALTDGIQFRRKSGLLVRRT